MSPAALGLAAIVALAFTVEASLGFGATVVTVALGSMILPIDAILPSYVPLNLLMSGYLVARYRREVDASLLGRRVLPAVLLGMPLGMLAFSRFDERWLKVAFGAFVVMLALLELASARTPSELRRPLPRGLALGMLSLGGVAHGAFGTGGPMVVYVLGRELGDDKARFRATLSVLWLVLNAVLVASFVVGGKVDAASATTTGLLVPPLALGLLLGEWLHARIPAARFRGAVFALLGVVGAALVVRNLS
jgi:uncharacterized protein